MSAGDHLQADVSRSCCWSKSEGRSFRLCPEKVRLRCTPTCPLGIIGLTSRPVGPPVVTGDSQHAGGEAEEAPQEGEEET